LRARGVAAALVIGLPLAAMGCAADESSAGSGEIPIGNPNASARSAATSSPPQLQEENRRDVR
jgi:hypothetical protein